MGTPEEEFFSRVKHNLLENLKLLLEEEIKVVIEAAQMTIEQKVKEYTAKIAVQMADQITFDNITHQVNVKIIFPKKFDDGEVQGSDWPASRHAQHAIRRVPPKKY